MARGVFFRATSSRALPAASTASEIFRADLFPAIAANPFITFFTTATESGKFEFEWIGDQGFSETASASITVE